MIDIKENYFNMRKPKNYSRKECICSCECPISNNGKIIDRIMVKYEVEPNKNIYKINNKNKNKFMLFYWGNFKEVIQLSPIFDKLEDDDFVIKTSYFTRDNIQMPFIYGIEIKNIEKYKMLKLKEERRKKLGKIADPSV